MLSNLFLNKTNTNNTEVKESQKLIVNGKEIHSLDELRENFDAEEILKALNDGSLKSFLSTHYYEREANAIAGLTLESKDCLKKICAAIKVDYLKQDFVMTPEVEARLEVIKQFTTDERILQNFSQIALNQEELATLLNNGEKIIYLCHNKFSIPLSQSNITYIGIDNPTIENAFTAEQYKKAGIVIKNINLPSNVSKEMSEYALNAAKQNGYDDYSENHSTIATYFHNKLKSYERFSHVRLPYDSSASHKEFNSEYAAKQALKEYLKKPYDAASALVNISNAKCIARTTAEEYAKAIIECFEPIRENLKTLFTLKNKNGLYENLTKLVSNSNKALRSKFEEEISDNQEYYNMYDFNYFVDRVSIEEHDYRTSEGFFKVVETLFQDSIEYTYDDFLGAVFEMEKDINDHVSSFYKSAYSEYLSYVKEIEKIFEELGTDYPEFKEKECISDYLTRISLKEIK